MTGATSCATGTSALAINGINICAGSNVTSWTFGGSYFYNGDGCTPNTLTNQCTCPDESYATITIGILVQSQWGPPASGSINLCVTLPSQQTNPNPGSLPNYVAMTVPNVTWASPTPTPTTPFPTTQSPIPPRPTSPSPPPPPTFPPAWVYIMILCVPIAIMIIGIIVFFWYKCRQHNEYAPIQ